MELEIIDLAPKYVDAAEEIASKLEGGISSRQLTLSSNSYVQMMNLLYSAQRTFTEPPGCCDDPVRDSYSSKLVFDMLETAEKRSMERPEKIEKVKRLVDLLDSFEKPLPALDVPMGDYDFLTNFFRALADGTKGLVQHSIKFGVPSDYSYPDWPVNS
jgi:hypothetical protein